MMLAARIIVAIKNPQDVCVIAARPFGGRAVLKDPRTDHQPIREASYVNIPVIAFCDTDSPLRFVDVAIPANNKARNSIGLLYWMLAREVLRLRGTISRQSWDVVVDLFFYRDPEEAEKQLEEAQAGEAEAPQAPVFNAPAADYAAVPRARLTCPSGVLRPLPPSGVPLWTALVPRLLAGSKQSISRLKSRARDQASLVSWNFTWAATSSKYRG